ncbi:hypothetical protein CVIRNUC_004621 [Coccomyxa viridis]|uniref:Extracellular protein n=1 Tax=Coccomyxa viridis TaxID=1274662 RepID=A0AAV1I3N8_9CHLO|nr:hypothetical protein CVIRNUC_004621 [Coccomyxa viridis]
MIDMRFGTVLVGLLLVGAAVAQDIAAPEAAPALAPLSALTHDLGAALAPSLTKRKILALHSRASCSEMKSYQ